MIALRSFLVAVGGVALLSIAQADDSAKTRQIPAGQTAALVPAKGSSSPTAKTPQGKLLKNALKPETRQTLQEAMNSGQ